jgi:hypothetical protein
MTLLKPSDTEFYAIGRMVVYVGYIEQSISETYRRVCEKYGCDYNPYLLISKKMDLIKKSISTEEQEMLALIKITESLLKKRNNYIHGQYYGDSMSKNLFLYSVKNNRSRKILIRDIDEISKISLDCRNAWKRMTITRIRLKRKKTALLLPNLIDKLFNIYKKIFKSP